jgi:hypothetical protein
MQIIELWDVARDKDGVRDAVALASASADEAERLLEDLIVRQPALLGRGMSLIGRQLPTAGGPLDLLGLDQAGRVVVFELKRGLLTREAVAQVLDYASDLLENGEEHFARLVETNSGRNGIPAIEDFADWYSQQYPDSEGPLSQPPRMILVGLGADERARRVASFLAQRSVEIELLTFHAFRAGERLLFARLSESEPPKSATAGAGNKESNRRALQELADQLEVKGLLEDVASCVAAHLPGAYRWPGKTSYAFSLQEQTDAGRPTLRAYITLYLDPKRKRIVLFNITPRAASAGGEAVGSLVAELDPRKIRSPRNQYVEHEIQITPEGWASHRAAFETTLKAIYAGWQTNARTANSAESRDEAGVEPKVPRNPGDPV